MDNTDELNWLEEFRKGNQKAIAYFFDRHHKSLFYFASNILQDSAQAEEIVSDCFLKLWERHQDFETAQNIKAFLFISCRNNCLKYLRDMKRRSAAQEQYFQQLETNSDEILYEIIDVEIIDILAKEIEELPDKCRQIFKMIYFQGKKTDEIATELSLSVQTVRNQKTRALELLKAQLLKKNISATMILSLIFFLDQ